MRTIKSFWAIAECLVYAAVYEQMPETHRMWCWQGVPAGGNIVAVRLAGVWLVLSGFASLRLAPQPEEVRGLSPPGAGLEALFELQPFRTALPSYFIPIQEDGLGALAADRSRDGSRR